MSAIGDRCAVSAQSGLHSRVINIAVTSVAHW